MQNKNSIKVKAGVLLTVLLMFGISLSSVLGGTVSNDDIKTTTTDSDLEINYENATIKFLEQFMINGTVNRWFNNSSDNYETMIVDSNGNYLDATSDNFQTAIDKTTNGGTITYPAGTIYTGATMYINNSNNLTIVAIGNGTLKCADDTTLSNGLIQIRDSQDITIQNLILDGNSIGGGNTSGIYITNVGGLPNDRNKIINCKIFNTRKAGIYAEELNNSRIEYNTLRNIGDIDGGLNWDNAQTGIILVGANAGNHNNTIANNDIKYTTGHGIKVYRPNNDVSANTYNKILFNKIAEGNHNFVVEPSASLSYGTGIDVHASGTFVEGNTIYMNGYMLQGIVCDSHDNIIKNNNILNVSGNFNEGITLTGQITHFCYNNIVSDNFINGSTSTKDLGIFLRETRGNRIIGNNVTNCDYASIQFVGAGCDMDNNIISFNSLGSGTIRIGETVPYKFKDNIFAYNDVSRIDTVFTSTDDAIAIMLMNNTIKDNIGYNYTSIEFTPIYASSPFEGTIPDGATWICSTNMTYVVGFSDRWFYFNYDTTDD